MTSLPLDLSSITLQLEEAREERRQALQQLEEVCHIPAAEQEVVQLPGEGARPQRRGSAKLGQVLANVCFVTHHEPAGMIFPPSLTHFS